MIVPRSLSPTARRIPGYTGCRAIPDAGTDALNSPLRKLKIPGYTGHMKGQLHVIGERTIPSEHEQLTGMTFRSVNCGDHYELMKTYSQSISSRHMATNENEDKDLQEIYLNALEALWRRGQTPQMLLRMLQGKVSERNSCFADQQVRVRKLFQSFDYVGSGSLNISGFRKCLEHISCQFDEVQSLALFAFFDEDRSGTIDWEELAENVMVVNPKSGKLVPKPITATMFNEDWQSLSAKILS